MDSNLPDFIKQELCIISREIFEVFFLAISIKEIDDNVMLLRYIALYIFFNNYRSSARLRGLTSDTSKFPKS